MKWMRSEWISEEKTKRQGANNKRSQIGTFNTNKGNLKNWNWNNFSLNYFNTEDFIEIIFCLHFFLFRWHLCLFYYAPLYVLNNAWHASLQHNVASVLFAFLSNTNFFNAGAKRVGRLWLNIIWELVYNIYHFFASLSFNRFIYFVFISIRFVLKTNNNNILYAICKIMFMFEKKLKMMLLFVTLKCGMNF